MQQKTAIYCTNELLAFLPLSLSLILSPPPAAVLLQGREGRGEDRVPSQVSRNFATACVFVCVCAYVCVCV